MEDQSVATGRSAVGNLIEQPRSKTKQNYARVGPMRNYARVGPMPSKKSYCIVILAIMAVVRGGGVLLRARVCGAGYSAQPPPPTGPLCSHRRRVLWDLLPWACGRRSAEAEPSALWLRRRFPLGHFHFPTSTSQVLNNRLDPVPVIDSCVAYLTWYRPSDIQDNNRISASGPPRKRWLCFRTS